MSAEPDIRLHGTPRPLRTYDGTAWTPRALYRAFMPRHSIRERRMLWLLAVIWVLSGFDLGFTLVARSLGMLDELNPVAAFLIDLHSDRAMVVYKLLLMAAGTILLWRYRHHSAAEWSTWLVALAYVALALRWQAWYYDDELPYALMSSRHVTAEFRTISRVKRAAPALPDQIQKVDGQ